MPIILFYDSRNIFVEAHFFVLRFDRVGVRVTLVLLVVVVAVAVLVALRPLTELNWAKPCPRLFNVGLVELPSAAFRFRFSWISSTDRGQPWFLSEFLSFSRRPRLPVTLCFWWEFWCAGLHLPHRMLAFACLSVQSVSQSVPHFMASTCNWFISPAVGNRSTEMRTAVATKQFASFGFSWLSVRF